MWDGEPDWMCTGLVGTLPATYRVQVVVLTLNLTLTLTLTLWGTGTPGYECVTLANGTGQDSVVHWTGLEGRFL